MSFSIVKTF